MYLVVNKGGLFIILTLQAVQFAIDKLKETVPIWKKEVYEEGGQEWKQNQECKWKEQSGT